ncbi:hypothetical protein PS910_03829 [Pseudomonas fluorescens]|nr:hypothetical protein PS910_03829 [Pseudomonas fluorescens]
MHRSQGHYLSSRFGLEQHRLLRDGQGADQVFRGLEKQGFYGGRCIGCFWWIWNDLQHGVALVCSRWSRHKPAVKQKGGSCTRVDRPGNKREKTGAPKCPTHSRHNTDAHAFGSYRSVKTESLCFQRPAETRPATRPPQAPEGDSRIIRKCPTRYRQSLMFYRVLREKSLLPLCGLHIVCEGVPCTATRDSMREHVMEPFSSPHSRSASGHIPHCAPV